MQDKELIEITIKHIHGNLAKAQFKVGQLLFEGEFVKQDKAMGINYIKMAFQNGYPKAYEYWTEQQMWKYEK